MVTRVLVAPVGPSLHKTSYSKEYYLLQSMARADREYFFDAYAQRVIDKPPEENVTPYELFPKASRTKFRIALFRMVYKKVRSGQYDVYHHSKLSYRSFNPVIAAGVASEIPTVIGPVQQPHEVGQKSMRNYLSKTTGVEWPQEIVDNMYPGLNILKRTFNQLREPLFGKTLRKADCVVVVNEATAELYSEFVPASKVEIVPYGVDTSRFSVGNPAEVTDIVAIGVHIKRKGFEPLLQAWSKIHQDFPESTLQIYGDGPLKGQLEQKAQILKIDGSVNFNGHVDHDEIRKQLARARAFVHPSLSEGFPHVRLEAMSSGCPVIASNIRGTREMIRDGIDGIVVPTNSVSSLATALETVLSNPEQAQEMGANARQHAVTKYDWEQIGNKMIEIYNDIQ